MIAVEFTRDDDRRCVRLTVDGHAGSAPKGQDIVCAAASLLIYIAAAIAQSAEDRFCDTDVDLCPGCSAVVIAADTEDEYERIISEFDIVALGYRLLADSYPDYVGLTLYGEVL